MPGRVLQPSSFCGCCGTGVPLALSEAEGPVFHRPEACATSALQRWGNLFLPPKNPNKTSRSRSGRRQACNCARRACARSADSSARGQPAAQPTPLPVPPPPDPLPRGLYSTLAGKGKPADRLRAAKLGYNRRVARPVRDTVMAEKNELLKELRIERDSRPRGAGPWRPALLIVPLALAAGGGGGGGGGRGGAGGAASRARRSAGPRGARC